MIVSHVTGGLGNQLYMYAFGRAYAEHVGTEHRVDIASYKDKGGDYLLHKYVLDRLPISPKAISKEELANSGIVMMVNEKKLRYNESIWSVGKDNLYINMYAADYRYSKPIIGKLRQELSPMVDMSGEFADLKEEMQDGDTVSLHVRLQDYVYNPNCYLLPVSYYRDALQVVANGARGLRVYLFTDQPEIIIRMGFNPGYPYTIISHGPDRNIEDLELMKSCKHHVVANSSYSFWGAWLDGRGGGITVVPDTYHDPMGKQLLETYGEVTQPSYPEDWNMVKVRYCKPRR